MSGRAPDAGQDLIPGVVEWGDVDWARARRVRFHVWQRFTYTYPQPVQALDQRLVVLPRDRLAHDFRMDGEGAMSEVEDSFGNTVIHVRVPEVEAAVTFETRYVVERDRRPAVGVGEGTPDRRFLEPTARTAPGPRVRELVRALPAGTDAPERGRAICSAVRRSLAYRYDVTDVHTSAEDALRLGAGVCQDFAHVMIAACRVAGLPARYVSGHLVGEGGTHAWVEVGTGDPSAPYIGLDPTHDREVGLSYVRVAAGRDYGDVAPTSGTYTGPPGGVLSAARRVAICGVGYDEGRRTA